MAYISERYFDLKTYSTNVECGVKLYWHRYGIDDWEGHYAVFDKTTTPRRHGIIGKPVDISHMLIDYSYDCEANNDIRQSGSITLKLETDEEYEWFGVRREDKARSWTVSQGYYQSINVDKIIFHIIKTYTDHTQGTYNEWDLGFFRPVSTNYAFSPTNGTVSISLQGLSCMLTSEYGGNVSMASTSVKTTEIHTIEGKDLNNWKGKDGFLGWLPKKDGMCDVYMSATQTMPMTCSIDKGVNVDGELFYDIAMGSWAKYQSVYQFSSVCPIDSYDIDYSGIKLYELPYQVDFDAETSRMEMINKILDVAYVEGKMWIDENRILKVKGSLEERGLGDTLIFWQDYGELFIDESVENNESGYRNITEVYGKDNKYYAKCDESWLDGEKEIKAQVLTFDELQSNEECMDRARWENWKARHHTQSVSINIADRFIPQFINPSNVVGNPIEYTTTDGETNLYVLDKISTSGTTISLSLSFFVSLYESDETRLKRTLAAPYVYKWELMSKDNDNWIRLYVTTPTDAEHGIDEGIIKLYGGKDSFNSWKFLGESCNEVSPRGNKYIDYPINQNGSYYFLCELYSPTLEQSIWGGRGETIGTDDYIKIDIDNLEIVEPPIDNYPYPHRNMYYEQGEMPERHVPYLVTERNIILTTEDGLNLST